MTALNSQFDEEVIAKYRREHNNVIFKELSDYDGVHITTAGNIYVGGMKGVELGKTAPIDSRGVVRLKTKEGKSTSLSVLKLMAMTFCPWYQGEVVKPVDGNRLNTALSNILLPDPDDPKSKVRLVPSQYLHYFVTDSGVVVKIDKSVRVLHQHEDSDGYLRVKLTLGSNVSVHRLVADAFCPNPRGEATVDHKNGNKKDNHARNLEWVSQSEQERRKEKQGLKVVGSVKVKCLETGKIYKSQMEACRELGLNKNAVRRSIRMGKPYAGYTFVLVDKTIKRTQKKLVKEVE